MKRLLMIDPNFPRASKSVNHSDIIPIGLLKIGAYYKDLGWDVKLLRLSESDEPINYEPDQIMVTSLFTYYSEYVIDAVRWAKTYYPNVPVEVGGIWASLMPKECKELTGADNVYVGVHHKAEEYEADYSLLSEEVDFQILHTQRGCHRRRKTCGVYCIEPEMEFKKSIKNLIHKKKVIFYDNNFLINPNVEKILKELILLKRKRIIRECECQSGFDGRILREKPYLAKMLKDAGFIFPKIAWDGQYKTWKTREEEINILKDAGFLPRRIGVFFLTNHDLPYEELEKKRVKCYEWGVQIIQCRYRPLDQLWDRYNGRRKYQPPTEYYIHPNWTHWKIKRFNRNIKLHNICVRFNSKFYSRKMEYRKITDELAKKVRYMEYEEAKKYIDDCWNPAEFHKVENE